MWEFLYHSFRVKTLSFYVLISTNTTERKKVYSGLTKIKISTILIATNSQLFENTLPLNEIVTTGETRNSKGPHTIDAANVNANTLPNYSATRLFGFLIFRYSFFIREHKVQSWIRILVFVNSLASSNSTVTLLH